MNRKPIFDAVRTLLGRGFSQAEVDALDAACDKAEAALPAGDKPTKPDTSVTRPGLPRTLGAAGTALIKKWEGCADKLPDGRYRAYKDPGSADGLPWTIGWGSTGSDVHESTVWTLEECEARFERDLRKYSEEVARKLGPAPTTQNQFDALVAFHYNTGKIGSATLTKHHKADRYSEAAAEFDRWIYNSGRPMRGLRNRRAEEAALYAKP